MTTATKRPAGRSGASRPKGRATSSSRSGRSASAKKSQARQGRSAGRRPAGAGRGAGGLLASMGAVAAGHATDLWGVVLVTLGVLVRRRLLRPTRSGPAGHDARMGVGDLLGWGRFLVPPVLIAVGVRMLMGDGATTRRTTARRAGSRPGP